MTDADNYKAKPDEWVPSQKQLALIQAVKDVGFGNTITALCEKAGVGRDSFYVWMKQDEGFKRAWLELPMKMLGNHLPGILSAMVAKAIAGDVAAAKLILETVGLSTSTVKHEITGKDGGPIQTENVKPVFKLIDVEANARFHEFLLMHGQEEAKSDEAKDDVV